MAATTVTYKDGQVFITPGDEAINLSDVYSAGVKLLSIEWSIPTSTDHIVYVGTDSSNTANLFNQQCINANQGTIKYFGNGKWLSNIHIPAKSGNTNGSGTITLTLASK